MSQTIMAKSIIKIDKVEIIEEIIDMNVDPGEVHEVCDIYHFPKCNLCNTCRFLIIYLKCNLEFSDNELHCSSALKNEIIRHVTIIILVDVLTRDLGL